MFKHPRRLSSKAVMPLASSVNMLDEQNEEQRGYRTSHRRSNISHSGHQTSNLPYGSSRNYSDKDCEGGEQQSWPSPYTWVQEPQNDVQQPLMRRTAIICGWDHTTLKQTKILTLERKGRIYSMLNTIIKYSYVIIYIKAFYDTKAIRNCEI